MARRIRMYESGTAYEIEIRAANEEYRLPPGPEVNQLILGVLGKALFLCPGIKLHYFVVMSNHIHMIVWVGDGGAMPGFLSFLFGQIARKVGRHTGISGPFWACRATVTPILDDESLIRRLRYLVLQGCKEGLVATPAEWPGASTYAAFVGDMKMVGYWHDRQRETRVARRGKPYDPAKFRVPYPIELTPIAPFAGLAPEALRRRHRALVASVVAETRKRNRALRRTPLGAAKVCRQPLRARPERPKRGPAPLCHGATPQVRDAHAAKYRAFVGKYRSAAVALRAGVLTVEFPPGCFPSRRPWVPFDAPDPAAA